MKNLEKLLQKAVSLAVWLTMLLIVVGAATRVTQSGMACPDWPMCYGLLFPFPEPESGYIVNGIHHQWWQVLYEWGHRLLASLVGFIMIIIAVSSFVLRKDKPKVFYATLVALLLLACQIKMGRITVLLSNVNWSVAVHLGNAMLFLAALIVVRKLINQPKKVTLFKTNTLTKLNAWSLFVLVLVTMLMGAMVSSSYAGGICGGLFSCMGEYFPSDTLQEIHMAHRFLALLVILTSVTFFMAAKSNENLKRIAIVIKSLVFAQVVIGVTTLYSFSHYAGFYHFLSVFHLFWGTVVFVVTTGMLAKIYFGVEGGFHGKK